MCQSLVSGISFGNPVRPRSNIQNLFLSLLVHTGDPSNVCVVLAPKYAFRTLPSLEVRTMYVLPVLDNPPVNVFPAIVTVVVIADVSTLTGVVRLNDWAEIPPEIAQTSARIK